MLTKQEIESKALAFLAGGEAPLWGGGFVEGAKWANMENEKELAALRAENARLRQALETALAEGMKTRAGRAVVRSALDFELPDRP